MIALVAAQRAGQAAYEEAGITASDIDLAELYAPCTIIEILASEALGLLPRGQGARLCAEGETSLGGRIPVCTSGGLQSRGHPAHVTPFYSFFELNEQLTGRAGERQVKDCNVVLTTGHGGELVSPGMCSIHTCTLLGRHR